MTRSRAISPVPNTLGRVTVGMVSGESVRFSVARVESRMLGTASGWSSLVLVDAMTLQRSTQRMSRQRRAATNRPR